VGVDPVGHAADDGVFAGLLREQGKQLVDLEAGGFGGDGLVEGAAVIVAGRGLGIEGVEVSGAAPHPDLDHRFGLGCRRGRRPQGPQTEMVSEHQPRCAEQGALDRFTPGDCRTGHAGDLFVRPGLERFTC